MALTQNIGSTFAAKFGTIQKYVAGAAIFRGATVAIRQGDGLAYPATDDTSDTYKQLVVGYAMEAAAIGASIRVRQDGKLKRKISGSPAVVVGRLACIKDDETVQLYGALSCKVVVGRITEAVGSIEVFVDFTNRPARLASSAND